MIYPPLERAKCIAAGGLSMRIPAERGLFPPPDVLNAFFECGRDDLPNGQVLEWQPFILSQRELNEFFTWWRAVHPQARVERLGVAAGDFRQWFSRAVACPPQPARARSGSTAGLWSWLPRLLILLGAFALAAGITAPNLYKMARIRGWLPGAVATNRVVT